MSSDKSVLKSSDSVDPEPFHHITTMRLTQDQYEEIKMYVKRLPLSYTNLSHFFRIAIVRELRRSKKILDIEKQKRLNNQTSKLNQ